MAGFDWKALVGQVAPSIGAALGTAAFGPAGAVVGRLAVQKLSSTLLGRPDGTEDEVSAAVLNATPDQLLAIKQADNGFAEHMRSLDIDLERIAAGDRDSARRREVDSRDPTPHRLAYLIVAGAVAVGSAVFFVNFANLNQVQATLMGTVVGYVFAELKAITAYYFGSSTSSRSKDDTIATITKG